MTFSTLSNDPSKHFSDDMAFVVTYLLVLYCTVVVVVVVVVVESTVDKIRKCAIGYKYDPFPSILRLSEANR